MDRAAPPAASAPPVDSAATGASSSAAADEVPADVRTAALLLALLAFTIPLAVGMVLWAPLGADDDWNRRVSLAPFDLVQVAIVGWVALRPRLVLDLFRSRSVQLASAALALIFLGSFAANPSWLGLSLGLRLVAGLCAMALVGVVWPHREARTLVLGSIAAVGALQAVLAMVQSARGVAFGIDLLDFSGPLYPFGSSRAGRGGLTHPYHLAVLLVVAQGAALLGLRLERGDRRPWLLALVLASAGIGVTYTRAGAIGQVALVACLLLGRADRRALRAAAVAIVLGLGVGGLAFGDGWLARGATTTGADGSSNPDSSRSVRLAEARELIEDHPLTGVGPGRYVDALAEVEREEYLPAHNLIAHSAAELGLLGGAAVLALLGLLVLRAWRGGAWAMALFLPIAPFLLLDAYPYVFATGIATSGLWLGLLRAASTGAAPDGAPDPEAEADAGASRS